MPRVRYPHGMSDAEELKHVTLLLRELEEGTPGALDRLMDVVHDELSRMAASQLRRRYGDRAGQITLEPAALVNESYLRLIRQRQRFDNRGQFFAIATTIMLRVLSDHQRERAAAKRGGGARQAGSSNEPRTLLAIDDSFGSSPDKDAEGRSERTRAIEIEALIASLDRLQALDQRKADIVRMRVVWGMTVPVIAEALGISTSSVDREWRFAKAWLATE
jgi:RNA polymerase sigma-70 factor, ECF subfamily